ncbi:MAG TPA: DnaJ C-terminal domain-containing protein [Steroidobacteraceae bacterium]|nr:DnaJ C-terminal domain-containing protein [Steroidobacteraceae bacterium]
MKYKDYYSALGVERTASEADIKAAYRKLARKYHPDVSKEAGAEERFKEVSEAYKTLKDADKRKAYDQLGSHRPGEEFRPPPDWGSQFGGGGASFSFEDLDLSDIFETFAANRQGGSRRRGARIPGQDYEVNAPISLEDAFKGAMLELNLELPERDEQGLLRRVPHPTKVRIPKGATDGQRLRVPGKGGKGINGGRDGDLYLNIALRPHPLFRAEGHDLYLELPLTPWEAALGATVEVPTLAGAVALKVPPGTRAGQKLRLAGRGLPKPHDGAGDLFAVAQIAVPTVLSERERSLFKELAGVSAFNPRGHFDREKSHAH